MGCKIRQEHFCIGVRFPTRYVLGMTQRNLMVWLHLRSFGECGLLLPVPHCPRMVVRVSLRIKRTSVMDITLNCIWIWGPEPHSQWSERPGFNSSLSHTKDSRMVLDTSLLNTLHYIVRIKGGGIQGME